MTSHSPWHHFTVSQVWESHPRSHAHQENPKTSRFYWTQYKAPHNVTVKGIFKFCVDFDCTVSDGIWYCLCLYGSVVLDWSYAVEFTNYGGLAGALTTIGCVIIFLILLKSGWKVSTCVRMTPVKSFLYQTTHSTVRWDLLGSVWKSYQPLKPNMINNTLHLGVVTPPVRSPKRDQYIRACSKLK